MPYPKPKIDLEEARRLRKEGWQYGEIGELFGVTKQAVHFALKKKKRRGPPKRRKTAVDLKEAKRLYKQGWTARQIGEHLGFSTGGIYSALRNAGVKFRKGGPYPARVVDESKVIRAYVEDGLTLGHLSVKFHASYPRIRKILIEGGAEIRERQPRLKLVYDLEVAQSIIMDYRLSEAPKGRSDDRTSLANLRPYVSRIGKKLGRRFQCHKLSPNLLRITRLS